MAKNLTYCIVGLQQSFLTSRYFFKKVYEIYGDFSENFWMATLVFW